VSFLSLQSLRKAYGPTRALGDVDLTVARGSRTAIVGASGSGKTTLLRLVAGFDVPDAGRIMLDGQILADGPNGVPAYLRGVGLVVQEGGLFPHLTIAENIGFGLDRRAPGRDARIADLTRMVGLEAAMLKRKPDELSGGQQQRVALARALARTPRLMLLDEPFSALDTALRASTRRATADLLRDAGITTVLVTHDQAEAMSFADHVVVMGRGQVLQAGTPHELYLRPATAEVAEMLGDAIILPAELDHGWADCALGRIATGDSLTRRSGRIVLRPEQIVLTPQDADSTPGGIAGQVMAIDFGGSTCTATVRVTSPDSAPVLLDRLSLRPAVAELGASGSTVRIAVLGQAHVLAEPNRPHATG
jgi:iron(III) transport system ATP-binding protein